MTYEEIEKEYRRIKGGTQTAEPTEPTGTQPAEATGRNSIRDIADEYRRIRSGAYATGGGAVSSRPAAIGGSNGARSREENDPYAAMRAEQAAAQAAMDEAHKSELYSGTYSDAFPKVKDAASKAGAENTGKARNFDLYVRGGEERRRQNAEAYRQAETPFGNASLSNSRTVERPENASGARQNLRPLPTDLSEADKEWYRDGVAQMKGFRNDTDRSAYDKVQRNLYAVGLSGRGNRVYADQTRLQLADAEAKYREAQEQARLARLLTTDPTTRNESGVIVMQDADSQARLEREAERLEATAKQSFQNYLSALYEAQYAQKYRYTDLPNRSDWSGGVEAGKGLYESFYRELDKERSESAAKYGTDKEKIESGYAANGDEYTWKTPKDNWSDDDLKTFYYLFGRDRDEAFQYALDTNFQLRAAERGSKLESLTKFAEFWGPKSSKAAEGFLLADVVTFPFALLDYIEDAGQYANTGTIMPRTRISASDFGTALTTGTSSGMNKMSGVLPESAGPLAGKGVGDLYQIAGSIGKSVTGAKTIGPASALLFFGDAAKQATEEAVLRGVGPQKSLQLGLAKGTAEVVGEYISLDHLVKMNPGNLKELVVGALLKQGPIEGLEEVNTDLIGDFSERTLLGYQSTVNRQIDAGMEAGMTYEDAAKAAWKGWTNKILWDWISGYVSGSFSAGIQSAPAAVEQYANRQNEKLIAQMDEANAKDIRTEDEAGNESDEAFVRLLQDIAEDRKRNRIFLRVFGMDAQSALAAYQQEQTEEQTTVPAQTEESIEQPTEAGTGEELTEQQQNTGATEEVSPERKPFDAVDALTGTNPQQNGQAGQQADPLPTGEVFGMQTLLNAINAAQNNRGQNQTEQGQSQTPQEAAGATLAQGGTETAGQTPQSSTAQAPVLNSQENTTDGKAGAPSQQNIDNTANPAYNNTEKTAGGNANVEGRSTEEAGRISGNSVEGPGGTRGQSGGNSELDRVVLLSQKNADKIRGRKRPDGSSGVVVELHDGSADTAAFCSDLDAAKAADPKNGWAVDAKTPEGLAKDGARVYITDDGSAGFAVNADGDIVAVFSNKSAGAPKGTTESMIPQALAAGGTKLDCFGPVQAKIYAQHGFIPVARVKFDADFARENIPGWDSSKGEPPIYFMMHNGDSVDAVVDNFGKYHIPTADELDALPEMGYDDAYAYRDDLLAKQSGKDGESGSPGASTPTETPSVSPAADSSLTEGARVETGLVPAGQTAAETQGEGRISAEPPAPRNDTSGQKRSKTESHTLQHMAERLGGQQEELYYTPKSERESLVAAVNRVNTDMTGEMTRLLEKEMWTGEDIDTAFTINGILQADAVRTGDRSTQIAWGRLVTARVIQSGRALQAVSKWTRSGIAAAGQAAQQLRDAWEQKTPGTKGLTEEDIGRITNDVYDFANQFDNIQDGDLTGIRELIKRQAKYRNTWTFAEKNFGKYLNEVTDYDWLKEYALRQMMNIPADYTEEADLGQKLKTWQVNAQLSRLGTFFRNIGGNAVFGVQDTISQDFFGVALDALVGKKTGKRTLTMDKGWFSSEARKGARQRLVRSLLEVSGDVDMTGAQNRYGANVRRTFKMTGKAFDRFMSRWEQLMGYSLTSSDRFFRGGIEAEQTRGLEKLGLTEDEIRELRKNMADYRLFQNQDLTYRFSKGAHDVMNVIGFGGQLGKVGRQGGFGAGDLVMPYPGVPANLWAKALEYSPANFIKGGMQLLKLLDDVKTGKEWSVTRQQNAVMNVARGLHGTGLVALLAAMFSAGIFRNADDEDDLDAKALAKAEGRQGVQINLSAGLRWLQGGSREWQDGDKLMKIDWLEPMNAFLSIASLVADDLDDPWSYMADTAEGSLQALLDMPVMENISNLLDNYNYSRADTVRGKVGDAALGFAADALTGLLPAPISQTARAMDPYSRDTAGDSAAETALNRVLNAIPGLRQTLPEKRDNFGNPMEQGSDYDRWMNSFVRPGAITDYNADEMHRALDAFYKKTGDADVYPDRKAPNSFSVGNLKTTMTAEEKQTYQQVYGQTAERYYNSILLDREYRDLDDAERAWLLEEVRDYATYKARQAVMQGRGSELRETNEVKTFQKTEAITRTGVDMLDYLLGKKQADTDGSGQLAGQEIYDWLMGSDYNERQRRAIWDATKGTSTKTWEEYRDTNPVTYLMNAGLSQKDAQKMMGRIDTDGERGISQRELYQYYLAHPDEEALIREYWDNQRGFSTSWDSAKRKPQKSWTD